MSDRFSPGQNKLKKIIDDLVANLAGNEGLFVDAYVEAMKLDAKSTPRSVEDAKRGLKAILVSPNTPWIFFDVVTKLIQRLPLPTRTIFTNLVKIETGVKIGTGAGCEWLQPNKSGTWQVVWQLETDGDPEEQNVALDWYCPPDLDRAPIVPIGIIDHVSGSISLLRGNLILPSLSLLFIGLEAAIWDALVQSGVSRFNEKVTYKTVQWNYKKLSDKLVLSINGSDKGLDEFEAAVGSYPATGYFNLRKIGLENSKAILRIEVDEHLLGFFASDGEEKRESIAEKGLSEAVQRARKSDIMRTVPAQLDDTIIRLRNNLIHLSLDGKLDPPVPIPGSGPLTNHDQLRQEPKTASYLIHLVVDLINDIYSAP
jgi:hypothetical protein